MDKRARLQTLIEHYAGGNKSNFAKMLGVTPQAITGWIARNTFDIELVYAKCDDLSAEWLLTGEGRMLRSVNDDASVTLLIEKIAEQAERIGELKRALAAYVA